MSFVETEYLNNLEEKEYAITFFKFNESLFDNIRSMINDYKNNKYDCIEILFPHIENKYYQIEDINKTHDIIKELLKDDYNVENIKINEN